MACCTECGAAIIESARPCWECGTQRDEEAEVPRPRRRWRRWPLFGSIGFAILVAACVVIALAIPPTVFAAGTPTFTPTPTPTPACTNTPTPTPTRTSTPPGRTSTPKPTPP